MSSQEYDPDAAIDSQGQVIGDYVLGKTIGRGTFGKVKIGMHLSTGEKVAVKILEKCRILEIADAERVAREIKILKRNFHTNVIQLYQVIDTSEAIYLVMEYIDGGEMFEYIVKHHRIREKEAVFMFLQIVEALDYLHKNDVTHRDLKPENLLLQGGPNGIMVKVVDFGLSNTHEGDRLLQTACGSPCYAAPEMIEGKLYIGPKADIWSLGVILFAMVCGYLPFEDNNTSVLYKKILSGQYKAPNYISPSVQDLIRRILETNPDKRYSLEDIRAHTWCKTLDAPLPPNAFELGDKTLNKVALAKLEELGLKKELVAEAIQKGVHTAFSAAYYLMLNKVNRPTEPAVRRRRYSAYQGGKKGNVQTAMDEASKAVAKDTAPRGGQKSPPGKQQADPQTTPAASPPRDSATTSTAPAASPHRPEPSPQQQQSQSQRPSPPKPTPVTTPATAVEPSVTKEVTSQTSTSATATAAAAPPRGGKEDAVQSAAPTAAASGGRGGIHGPPIAAASTPPGALEPVVPSQPSSAVVPNAPKPGRSGKHLVEGSGGSTTALQPAPPSDPKDGSKPQPAKSRATIAMGNVLSPLLHQPVGEPALSVATQSKNPMPFNSNAAPSKPPTDAVVQKKRVSRHGSILGSDDQPKNYDLEMMKMLVNRETYNHGSIKEEHGTSAAALALHDSEGALHPNASSVIDVIKASSQALSRRSIHHSSSDVSSTPDDDGAARQDTVATGTIEVASDAVGKKPIGLGDPR
ncbi:Aste57867_14870 [Aphanomyces stellatus]|uniref:non-specific serine/threonine protein kinase n=1 Tax=Aphanomyces stellatus TaxID=120398 RepID=A0A485L227_9STRA|nr:hypothetical protein As57867_014814 [Aphanomyces stellatus]VFT91687.1 Aste57867_14870 [Aphanomyces stellatus]